MSPVRLPPCLVCGGSLSSGERYTMGAPDFPGDDPRTARGQTMSAVATLPPGTYAHCSPCKITYSVHSRRGEVGVVESKVESQAIGGLT